MSTSNTKLTLDNAEDGVLNATLECMFANGENVRLSFRLSQQQSSQTIEQVERAMWLRVREVADRILQP